MEKNENTRELAEIIENAMIEFNAVFCGLFTFQIYFAVNLRSKFILRRRSVLYSIGKRYIQNKNRTLLELTPRKSFCAQKLLCERLIDTDFKKNNVNHEQKPNQRFI
ncbi:MAG: hypothetical protein DRR00_13410 [Candidatus Parabeggiatoa sp. nov. 3]|jgi:hypothetical protein|nr:MAG: hypothetical protein DRR00_13410 [Gammaproteobacteria bacterium]RKZ62393.1 MAG: hypothetical protein DRQ99_18805 [Gammaproteobacteria bacterium]